MVTGLGNIIITLGEWFIGMAAAAFCYLVVTHYGDYKELLFEPFVPTLVSENFLDIVFSWHLLWDLA